MTLTRTDEDELDPVYRGALERAIAMIRARGGPDAAQIENKLRKEPWEDVGRYASYAQQCDNLHLGPHQVPPCWATEADLVANPDDPEDIYGRRAAAVLHKRLLEAGLSAYEPDRSAPSSEQSGPRKPMTQSNLVRNCEEMSRLTATSLRYAAGSTNMGRNRAPTTVYSICSKSSQNENRRCWKDGRSRFNPHVTHPFNRP
jgi:hypothetical protein